MEYSLLTSVRSLSDRILMQPHLRTLHSYTCRSKRHLLRTVVDRATAQASEVWSNSHLLTWPNKKNKARVSLALAVGIRKVPLLGRRMAAQPAMSNLISHEENEVVHRVLGNRRVVSALCSRVPHWQRLLLVLVAVGTIVPISFSLLSLSFFYAPGSIYWCGTTLSGQW